MEKREQLSFVLKREIVQRLARFDTPGQVVKAIKADHGIDLSPQRVQFYDPTSKNGAALSDELKTLFQETRKKFLEDLDAIPIANKAVRLRRLDRMATLAEERGNMVLAAELGERAAKETAKAIAGTADCCPKCESPRVNLYADHGIKFYGRQLAVCANCRTIWEPLRASRDLLSFSEGLTAQHVATKPHEKVSFTRLKV